VRKGKRASRQRGQPAWRLRGEAVQIGQAVVRGQGAWTVREGWERTKVRGKPGWLRVLQEPIVPGCVAIVEVTWSGLRNRRKL
jgi:hypothetical protein